MLKETTVTHKKGQKHSGKSNWDKLIHMPAPVIDEENPGWRENSKLSLLNRKKFNSKSRQVGHLTKLVARFAPEC